MIEAETVEDLVIKTNAALKISEGAINKVVTTVNETKARLNTVEQSQIRAALENEHLKLIGMDLDQSDCTKNNAWEISAYAKDKMIKNYYACNKEVADRSLTSAKDLGDNKYVLAHNPMVRMTVNAMGKAVKKNDKGVTSVALLLFSLWVIRSSSDPEPRTAG